MTEPILEKLFGSHARVQILKLFLRNPEDVFSFAEIGERLQLDPRAYRRDLQRLEEIEFIKKKHGTISVRRRRTIKARKGKKMLKQYIFQKVRRIQDIYSLNKKFVFYGELKSLVLKSSPASIDAMCSRLRYIGKIKLVLIAGEFLSEERKRVDLFIVGERIHERRLKGFLANLDAEVGKKVDYSIMTPSEFHYRYNMYDRFLRDVLDYPHYVLINKMRVEV